MADATPLIVPQLGPVYQTFFPWVEMLLRAVVGLTLVPHGLRSTFGMFSSTGALSHNLTEFANELDHGAIIPENSGRLPSCSRSSSPVRCSHLVYSLASPPARSSFSSS